MILKDSDELSAMRRAGLTVRDIVRTLVGELKDGVTTGDISRRARTLMGERDATGLFRGYQQRDTPPFPADVCVSVNDEVVHGVPGQRVLRTGDVVTIDCGLRLDGWCADHAVTEVVGGPESMPAAARLIESSARLLDEAIGQMRPGERWSAIARRMEEASRGAGYGIVTEYVGHGIGRDLHEPPKAPCYWSGYSGPDFTLSEGLVLAVEPILTLGRGSGADRAGGLPGWRMPVEVDERDGWTVRTSDGSIACHVEHTVAVRAGGAEVLTG